MLIGLFVIPSGLCAAHDKLAPLFVKLNSSVGIIIGVLLQKTWNIDAASNKDSIKVLVGYPESLMILSDMMILTYNIAMHLMCSGWWRCIKTKPPDPVPPVIGSVRRVITKQYKVRKRITDPIILGLIAASTVAAEQVSNISLKSIQLR